MSHKFENHENSNFKQTEQHSKNQTAKKLVRDFHASIKDDSPKSKPKEQFAPDNKHNEADLQKQLLKEGENVAKQISDFTQKAGTQADNYLHQQLKQMGTSISITQSAMKASVSNLPEVSFVEGGWTALQNPKTNILYQMNNILKPLNLKQ